MSDVIDAFGEIYLAYYRGKPSNHITERDDGFIREASDAYYYFRPYEEWPKFEQEAIQEAKGKVLDIGLGAGRHALYLQEKGLEVVGIDNSPLAIQVSRLRGVKDCLVMDLHQLNFPKGYFDTVLMLGANLGLGEVHEVQAYLLKLYGITTSNGIIIGHTRDPLKTSEPRHLAYHEMNRQRNRPPGLIKVRIGFDGKVGQWFDLLLMGEDLLRDVVKPTGWKINKTYRSDDGDYITMLSK